MWDNFIGRHIRRGTRNLFIWNALILLGLTTAAYFSSRYYYNFFLGPFQIERTEWMNLRDPERRLEYYVAISGEKVAETGLFHKKDRTRRGRKVGETVVSRDLLLAVDAGLVVVIEFDPKDAAPTRTTGILEPLVQANTHRDAAQKHFGKDMQIAPVKVDATGFRLRGWIGLAVMVPLGLLATWNIIRAVKRWNDPARHPLTQQLERYGDPADVSNRIEEEWDSADKLQLGPVTVTCMWCIQPHTFGMTLVHLGEAVWVYKSATKHYHNGIPTGTTFAGVLCDNQGQQHNFPLKGEPLCDDFVRAIAERIPWILTGYDDGLAQMWKSQKTELYQLLEERRQEFAAQLRSAAAGDNDPDDVQEVLPA